MDTIREGFSTENAKSENKQVNIINIVIGTLLDFILYSIVFQNSNY